MQTAATAAACRPLVLLLLRLMDRVLLVLFQSPARLYRAGLYYTLKKTITQAQRKICHHLLLCIPIAAFYPPQDLVQLLRLAGEGLQNVGEDLLQRGARRRPDGADGMYVTVERRRRRTWRALDIVRRLGRAARRLMLFPA
jgi:hypothetical protein